MTPERQAHILSMISRSTCADELSGLVSGLRNQGELSGPIPAAIVHRCRDTGWRIYEPFPELNPPMRSENV